MNNKIFEISLNTNCLSGRFDECSNAIIEKLKPLGLKLIANTPQDVVNGFVSIVHDSQHLVRVEIYTQNEKPNNEHQTTFEKPITMPSENQIKNLII